ncbi:uncharacterized protein LOC125680042 isoform X3 [Ostrea edulis]|nr:uncharacterized protein LOC125680042 isoform X3 [Ostrea edulis]
MAMDVTNGCEVTTTELTIYPAETIIDWTIGKTLELNCQPTDASKVYHFQWKHYVGVENILLRTFNTASITLSNMSYLDIGKYRCMGTAEKCVQKEITVNVMGMPAVVRKTEHVEIRDDMKITFALDIISFPSPHENVTVGLCNGKKKTVFNVSWDSRLLTARKKYLEYKVLGYQMNLSISVEALPEYGLYCVDISNTYGLTSFHLYGNITNSPNDSTNDETLLSFLRENMTMVTLGGLGLLMFVFLSAVVVLCRKLKTVENRR